jgi:hypothetical protein
MTAEAETHNIELTKKQYLEVNKIVDVAITKLQKGFDKNFEKIEKMLSEINKMKTSITLLNFKSGIWAALGASIPTAVGIVWFITIN